MEHLQQVEDMAPAESSQMTLFESAITIGAAWLAISLFFCWCWARILGHVAPADREYDELGR